MIADSEASLLFLKLSLANSGIFLLESTENYILEYDFTIFRDLLPKDEAYLCATFINLLLKAHMQRIHLARESLAVTIDDIKATFKALKNNAEKVSTDELSESGKLIIKSLGT